ncbi:MAG: DUF1499 domain-containing protein [Euryarchaeota archaeon]|nr:DUF1499 domain-containing protein [Euryarchaeota archaeon]
MVKSLPKVKRNLIIVLLLCSPWFACQVWIQVSAPDEVWTSMPTCPTDSQNCVHLGGDTSQYRSPINMSSELQSNATTVWLSLLEWVDSNGIETLHKETNGTSDYYVHLVQRTSFFRFPDDLVVRITQNENGNASQALSGSVIEIHSQSRLGTYDAGENTRRLELLHSHLSDAESIWDY